MKKPLSLLAVSTLLFSILLSACGGTTDTPGSLSPAPEDNLVIGEAKGPELSPEDQAAMEAFRELLASPADVQGVVTKVVGNSVTLKLIEPFQGAISIAFPGDGQASGADFTPPEGWTPPEGLGEGEFFFQGIPGGEGGMAPPDGGDRNVTRNEDGSLTITGPDGKNVTLPEGGMIRGDGNGPRVIRGGNFADIELPVTYTGEETTLTIPVSLEIYSGPTRINATGLKNKQILSVWYDEEGNIANVMVNGTAAPEGSTPNGDAVPPSVSPDLDATPTPQVEG